MIAFGDVVIVAVAVGGPIWFVRATRAERAAGIDPVVATSPAVLWGGVALMTGIGLLVLVWLVGAVQAPLALAAERSRLGPVHNWSMGLFAVELLAVLAWMGGLLARRALELRALEAAWARRTRGAAPSAPATPPDRGLDDRGLLDRWDALRADASATDADRVGELGALLRRWLQRGLGVPTRSWTTEEVDAGLRDGGVDPERRRRIAELLRAVDQVKYASATAVPELVEVVDAAVREVVDAGLR